MLIQQRRVNNIESHLAFLKVGETIVIGLGTLDQHAAGLKRAGFASDPPLGESRLPPKVGPVSRFNADGGFVVHRDREKETVYHSRVHHYEQWHGKRRVPATKIIDMPYERYPRTTIPPPAVELMVAKTAVGPKALITPAIAWTPANHSETKHRVNLLLELFGECEVMRGDLEPLFKKPPRRVNWELLPKGKIPWAQLQRHLAPVLEGAGDRIRPVIESRLRFLESCVPAERVVGTGGFQGYVAYIYSKPKLAVLENPRYGNATYVFNNDWEKVSQLTKAEVIKGDLAKHRVVHRVGWEAEMRAILEI